MSLSDTCYTLFIRNKGKIFLSHLKNYLLLTVFLTLLATQLQDANYFMFFLLLGVAIISSGLLLAGKYALSMRIISRIILALSSTLTSIISVNIYLHGLTAENHFPIWAPVFLFLCSYVLYCIGITIYKKAP